MKRFKKISKAKRFQLNAVKYFLTYPQCKMEVQNLYEELRFKLMEYHQKEIKSFVIAKEFHEDGSPHLHAYILLDSKLRTYSRKAFTLDDGGQFPNIQNARSPANVINYILKDKDVSDEKLVLISDNLKEELVDNRILPIAEMMIQLARKGDIAGAMKRLEKDKPITYLKSHAAYSKSLRAMYLESLGFTPKYELSSFNIPRVVEEWIQGKDADKVLFIQGPSGCGKSHFMKALFHEKKIPYTVVRTTECFKRFDPVKHDVILFDDYEFPTENRDKIISLFDTEHSTTIDVKFGSVRIIEGTKRAVLSNPTVKEMMEPHGLDPAIARRVKEVNLLEGDLVKPKTEEPLEIKVFM